MKLKKTLALILVLTLVMATFAGCGGAGSSDSDTPLVIAQTDFSEKFSPFFAESVPDQELVDQTQIYLVNNDRDGEFLLNGIDGEVKEYNGTEYTYYTPCNVEIVENADKTMDVTFKLRDDLVFSDGEPVTADDIIFSIYVNCDPTYDGYSSVYALPIEGMEAYRSNMAPFYQALYDAGENNADFTYWTEEEQTEFFTNVLPKAGEKFAQDIVDYCIEEGYGTNVAESAEAWGFPGLADDATAADFFDLLVETYNGDLLSLSSTEKAGDSLLDLMGEEWCKGVATGTSAPNIAGIKRVDDYTVSVHTTEIDATMLSGLGIAIAPLHYYGDTAKYDYDNNMFGFDKGDLSIVKAKTNAPMGAGPYKFIKYENKIVYLEANDNFYLGAPKIKNIQYKTSSDSDMVPGVVQGTVDVAEPSASRTTVEQIASNNSNGELAGDKLTVEMVPTLGYGYIGMHSTNVCVGGNPGSLASKNLRKALATVLAVYRDVAIDSYYGDAAEVINYPISNSSWAAPKKSDADYKIAFSTDVNGNPIYTDSMTEDQKYEAALNAALGFFEAAGYTVENGKVTAAPKGAKMEYMIYVTGDGEGNHPSFGILMSAAEALKSIGFTLTVNDIADANIMWDAIKAGNAELWCAAWGATIDPDMFQIYHSKGGTAHYYAIYSDYLDQLVMDARANTSVDYRKAVYKEALDFIVDYAVEIPTYQRNDLFLFSTERVNVDSILKDQTTFYTYKKEL
ncbi:MAG: ABC transporter substrate-binding protein [Firmicutes bacterium]|nr:ABC transporter substrate-binding protein [Bacillota bacterium]